MTPLPNARHLDNFLGAVLILRLTRKMDSRLFKASSLSAALVML
jgi:hypothetical protein